MIQIQANFIGYSGKPCSLFSAYNDKTQILVVAAEAGYRAARREGCMVITNNHSSNWDGFFDDDNIQDAIKAFYALKGGVAEDGKSARLAFTDRAARANPDSAIERDGVDMHGTRYRVSDGVTCMQMAALATCHYAARADTIERTVVFADTLARLGRGEIVTV